MPRKYLKFDDDKRFFLIFLLLFVFSDIYSCEQIMSRHGGPYDYRNPNNYVRTGTFSTGVIPMIEVHFRPDVEMLTRKIGNASIAGDLSYTLREIPNHPRALNSASKYELKRARDPKYKASHRNLEISMDCYFKRAIKYFRNDSDVYFVYGIHSHRFEKYDQAIENYKKAIKLKANNPELHYNIGLSYIKINDLSNATKHAKIAYKKGYKLQGLQKQINRLKKSRVNDATQ